jgi:hypothetical protein
MSESMDEVQREIERTRERMSGTVAEIDARISERVEAVKERFDVVQLIRDNPWPALAIAVGAGVLLSATGADTKAAGAVKRAALATPGAVKSTAKRTADAVKSRFGGNDASDDATDVPEEGSVATERGFLGSVVSRLTGALAAPFVSRIDILVDEMRVASREVGTSLGARAGSSDYMTVRDSGTSELYATEEPSVRQAGAAPDTYGAVVIEVLGDLPLEDNASAEVPLPGEITPAEIDARADAVEAQGGIDTGPRMPL